MKEEQSVLISIPKELLRKLEKKAEAIGTNPVDKLIIDTLSQLVSDTEEKEEMYSEEDEEKIKERLRGLGYI